MTRRLLLAVAVVATWVALWGQLTTANVATGTVVAVATGLAFPLEARAGASMRWGPAVRYAALFVVDLVQSSLAVARLVLSPRDRVRQGIVAVPVRPTSAGLVTLVANSITLTPGTLTVEVALDPPTLYVHCLGLADPDEVRRDVLTLQRNAILAFGTAAERALLDPAPPAPTSGEGDA